jgi:hypothetical protein
MRTILFATDEAWRNVLRGGLFARCLTAILAGMILAAPGALAEGVRVTIDRNLRYQTITAWEASVDLFWPRELRQRRAEIFDRLADDIGITRLRVGIFSGTENTDRSFDAFREDRIGEAEWRANRYVTVNDDDDPFHINPEGFDFANLDWRIDTTVLPLRQRAQARGKTVEVNLSYMAFTGQSRPSRYIHTEPEEYAEFMLATFLHMQGKYGFVPDAVEVLHEPEHSPEWTPELLGQAIAAMDRRLKAAGFAPRVIAPSVVDARDAVPWISGIAEVPGAKEALRELSYQRKGEAGREIIEGIAEAARAMGLETSVIEFGAGRATARSLYNDLTAGNVSAWQGSAVAAHYRTSPGQPDGALILRENARYFRQYTAFIRPGDTRIGAESSDMSLAAPVAFEGPDGALVIVIRAGSTAQAEIPGLPAGVYRVSYAVQAGSGVIEQPFAVAKGTPLLVDIPGRGVITITSRPD